jgi:asparagine synthase (glutamine-hydrolysing)
LSAIYGVVRLGGPDVDAADLEAMRAPMAYWGPDGGGTWREGCAGLGQLVAHLTAEDHYEQGPIVVADGAIVVCPAGRLDNRAELSSELGLAPDGGPPFSDGRLIALAYERWGEEAVVRMLGDWAFAAWHQHERRLLLARDHYGHTALYWHRAGRSLVFASSLKGLLAGPDVPRRLNEPRLAETLVICAADGVPTLYEDVNRLPTAHLLTFDERGLRTRQFWSLMDVPEVRLRDDDAYVDELLDLFATAVRVRLRSSRPIATTLSAGLDSTAVTALAAGELGDVPLTAYTARPAFPEVASEMTDQLVDEMPGAAAVAARYRNVRHVEVRGRHVTPLAAIERSLWVHEEPEHAAPNLPWVTALLDQVAADGAGVLLTGQMGNGGPSWPGDPRRTLNRVLAGDAPGAMRALRHDRALGRRGWAGAVWRGIVMPLRRWVAAERMRRDPTRQPGFTSSLISPAFADRIGIVERVRASGWDPSGARASLRERRLSYLLPGQLPVTAWWHQRIAAHGIDVRDPTLHVPLLEFCVGVPDDQFAREGHTRWLMRRALEGLAPPEVAWNHRRGAQGADIAYRLRADAEAVSAAVADAQRSEAARAYLDVATIARAWDSVLAGGNDGGLELTRGLLVAAFLKRFE